MRRCCGRKIEINVQGMRYCKEHFLAHCEEKVGKVLYKARGSNLLVALSGGKDSMAALSILMKIKDEYLVKVTGIHIDLGMEGVAGAREIIEAFCEKEKIPLRIVNLKEEIGFSIDELSKMKLKRPVCSSCGLIKRYQLNKLAFESGADYVVTGHNTDDEVTFIMMNLTAQNVEQLSRGGPVTRSRPELKLVGRLKVLYYMTEAETRAYCDLLGIKYSNSKCPYVHGASQHRMKAKVNEIDLDFRNFKNGVLKSIKLLQPCLESFNSGDAVKQCAECDYPTTSGVCSYCRIVKHGTKN